DELCDKMVKGFAAYLRHEGVKRFALGLRGKPTEYMPLFYRSDAFGGVLRRLYDIAERYFGPAPGKHTPGQPLTTLLLNGETGSGKSQLARLLYRVSGRDGQGFQIARPADFKDNHRLNSTLFGHLEKAYPGAPANPGLVKSAGSGVLLLDDLHA